MGIDGQYIECEGRGGRGGGGGTLGCMLYSIFYF